ncbi:hypothetical protein M422DRAFT_37491 [Sphaerobolus stellatus SS14]|uniref:Uncharacterized protein n=1 Tax=Sphaerobolus stellatus (strain SS14) TaxID=990650 RepID=A0A0C9URJ2_SPHS4|nr:hypothetical protein M422DRAFT_37491 [Sphaerobolus stellatus SS14]
MFAVGSTMGCSLSIILLVLIFHYESTISGLSGSELPIYEQHLSQFFLIKVATILYLSFFLFTLILNTVILFIWDYIPGYVYAFLCFLRIAALVSAAILIFIASIKMNHPYGDLTWCWNLSNCRLLTGILALSWILWACTLGAFLELIVAILMELAALH